MKNGLIQVFPWKKKRFCKLEVPGSNPVGDFFYKITFFHGKTWLNTLSVDLIIFSQVLEKVSYFWIKLKKKRLSTESFPKKRRFRNIK